MSENNEIKELKEKLFLQRKNGCTRINDEELAACDKFCEGYKSFLDSSKTEREAVTSSVKLLESNGFVPFKKGMSLNAGDRVYTVNRGKAVIASIIGTAPIQEGT